MAKTQLKVVGVVPDITEERVADAIRKQSAYLDAKIAYDAAKKEWDEIEDIMIADIQLGAKINSIVPVSVGNDPKRHVKWRSWFEQEVSVDRAKEIMENTPYTNHFYLIING